MLNTKSLIAAALLTVTMAGAAHAQAYANVTVGGAFAPGVFGQISLGNNPPPPVMNVQPVIVGTPVYGAAPMYLHVAPEEYREWGRYCGRYRACGYPVHFVRVEQSNPWWQHHAQYLRGPSRYDLEEARRIEQRRDRYERRERYERHERHDRDDRREQHDRTSREFNQDPRFEAARGQR
jgi:hypothetical protein